MKFLFKLIFIPALTSLIVPTIFLATTYKNVEIPEEDFQADVDVIDLSEMINERFDAFLLDNTHDASFGLEIAQLDANQLLKSVFLDINPNYLNENAEDDEKIYVIKEPNFGYLGSWVRFKESKVEIESGLHVFLSTFTFKTSVLITFDVQISTDEVVLTLEKLNIGNLPLAWLFGPVDSIIERATGESIQTMIDNQLKGLATFDPETREIRLNINTLVESQFENDPDTLILVNSLLAFINENELVNVGFEDGSFNAGLQLGKMWEDGFDPTYVPANQKINTDAELEAILASRATTLLLSTLSNSGNLFIDVDALTLNRIFDYFLRDMIDVGSNFENVIQEQPILEGYTMRIMMPYIAMESDQFIVHIPFIISKDGFEETHRFESIIRISASTALSGDDLLINLTTISAGNGENPLTLEGEFLSSILALLGDESGNGLIQNGAFVIEGFVSKLVSGSLSISNIEIVDNKLRMYVDLGDAALVNQIGNAVQDVLDVLDNPEYSEELSTAIDDALTSLLDPEMSEAEVETAITNLMDTIATLDPEEQALLYDDLLAALENLEDFDYEDLLNLIP